jgi:hypothetical protein
MSENKKNEMSTKEIAQQLGYDIYTIMNHANQPFSGRVCNEVKTYFGEKEVTLILESIKQRKEDYQRLIKQGCVAGLSAAELRALPFGAPMERR